MADAPEFPNSYKDPLYASLDSATEQKLGLPSGMLSSVRTNGEKSNHDQVSEAGAKTPYQFTPTTRKLILDKYGIDPMLSPQNASESAGLLLKEGLDRNKGNVPMAVAEYHAGPDRANWGPITKAYVARVTKGLGDAVQPAQGAGAPSTGPLQPTQSSFDKALANQQETQAPSQVNAIYQAYKSGQMTPDEQQQFEGDVRSGAMMLPRGAALNSTPPGAGGAVAGAASPQIPDGVMKAYMNGSMTPQEMTDFEHDVRTGSWKLPDGATPDVLFGAPDKPKSIGERIAAMPGALAEAVTGNQRRNATTDALPDWAGMPELNQLSMASAKTGIGTMLTDPAETAQIIKANFPNAQVSQDESGNYLIRSSVDGKQYAIKPGFRVSDIPRALGALAAFTPAGRAESLIGAGVKSAATQAAIEGTQAATGGNFDTGQVVAAGLGGVAVPGAARVLGAVAQPIKAGVQRVLGTAESAAPQTLAEGVAGVGAPINPGAAPAAAAPSAAPAAIAAPAASVQEVAQTARKAAEGGMGSGKATEQLAALAAPSSKTSAAAERLGIGDYLQSDHVTTNDAYRQVVGVLKSNPTSTLAQGEKEGLAKVAQRASDLIDEVGGTGDLSAMDASVKARMQATHAELGARENALYQQLREAVPAGTEAPATTALQFVEQRAKDLGGVQNLTPMEKQIVAKLSPKGGDAGGLLESLSPSAQRQAAEQGFTVGKQQPTFALLDDVRKDVGAAARQAGPFSDADTGLAKKLYSLLTNDQAATAERMGAGDLAVAAKGATVVRKGMEEDLASLFGKNLDGSLVGSLGGAMKSASAGDTSKLLGILKSTPDAMKQEVVASGLTTVFRNAATRGEINFTGYAKWYEGLLRNKQAYSAVMSNLPGPARKQLSDLYRVSSGISQSLGARIKTGLRSSVLEEMQAPDTLASKMFELAKHAGKGLAVDAVGGHGAGITMGIMSALSRGKTPAIKAIDDLLTSPEFMQAARASGTPAQADAARAFAYSKGFTRFVRAVGQPRELSDRERWVQQALQSDNQTRR